MTERTIKRMKAYEERVQKAQTTPLSITALKDIYRVVKEGHAGYGHFSSEIREQFEKGFEKLIAKGTATIADAGKLLDLIPDRHLYLTNEKETLWTKKPNEADSTVGHNMSNTDTIVVCPNGTAFIALPDIGDTQNLARLSQFVDEFNQKIVENKNNINRIILDVRDNPGGSTMIFDYIARTLQGNEVTYCDKEMGRNTTVNKEIRRQNGIDDTPVIVKDYRGFEEKHPFNPEKGFDIPIAVLQNRNTASAGESFAQLLKNHPKTVFIGENTGGYAHYRSSAYTTIAGSNPDMPMKIKLAAVEVFFSDHDGNPIHVEGVGFKPDIDTIGQDAFKFLKTPEGEEQFMNTVNEKENFIKNRYPYETVVKEATPEGRPFLSFEPSAGAKREGFKENNKLHVDYLNLINKINTDIKPDVIKAFLKKQEVKQTKSVTPNTGGAGR